MPDPNRKDTEPKIALSPPALFALAAVIFFLAGGIFAYNQLIGRGLQKTTASATPYLAQEQTGPLALRHRRRWRHRRRQRSRQGPRRQLRLP
jgi:hypothetical protein